MRLRASSSGTSKGDPHDCWTTTEAALTRDLSDDLREAWERLRETAVSFGDQRIYASHKSIMFSRKSCYFFVRPKKTALEVCVFLARALTTPQVRRVDRASKSKLVHFIHLQHRHQVEAPITDWLREAYELSGVLATRAAAKRVKKKKPKVKGKSGDSSLRSYRCDGIDAQRARRWQKCAGERHEHRERNHQLTRG